MNILDLIDLLEELLPGSKWSIPPKIELGVLSSNYAFEKAKKVKKNPIEITLNVAKELNSHFFENNLPFKAQTAGPYLNIDLTDNYWEEVLAKKFEIPKLKTEKESFVIDMFHPNVGKKTHVGHMRSGNLGECMRRILSLKYENVVSDSYLGDWGIQFSYTTWGILNLSKLDLEFQEIDLRSEDKQTLIDKFYRIYVRMNQLIEEQPEIKKECQSNSKLLEKGMQGLELDVKEKEKYELLHDLYGQIVSISLVQFKDVEKYLRLNQNPWWLKNRELIDEDKINLVKERTGCHYANSIHKDGEFDLTLGESFYISFISETEYLVETGLAKKEGKAVYVDLENENLGRCYLISSEGYSLYQTRDIFSRIVYSGLFGFDNAITFADSRQKHNFEQFFAVLKRIVRSKIYEKRKIGWFSREQTDRALSILKRKMAMFEGFGHLNLPEGASMSTRKGKIIEFRVLKENLKERVRQTLLEKDSEDQIEDQKVEAISVAALKWMDLHRDREQDVIFNLEQFLKFEGNTGVYQLYTIVRLNSILENNYFDTDNLKSGFDKKNFNQEELNILKKTYTLPLILEKICQNYKPHHLCSYLFELTTDINSWYGKYSVTNERDESRKLTLLILCYYLKQHLSFGLSLLGINTVEKL